MLLTLIKSGKGVISCNQIICVNNSCWNHKTNPEIVALSWYDEPLLNVHKLKINWSLNVSFANLSKSINACAKCLILIIYFNDTSMLLSHRFHTSAFTIYSLSICVNGWSSWFWPMLFGLAWERTHAHWDFDINFIVHVDSFKRIFLGTPWYGNQ